MNSTLVRFVLARLKEPSSYAGLGAVVGANGIDYRLRKTHLSSNFFVSEMSSLIVRDIFRGSGCTTRSVIDALVEFGLSLEIAGCGKRVRMAGID